MKIECIKENLYKALTGAERVTAKQLPLQVLSAVVLKAKDKNLLVQATNLSVSLEYNVSSRVIKEGEVAVPSKTFLQLINNLPQKEKITLELVENNLHITTSKTNSTVKTLSLEDYPTFNKLNKPESEIKIDSEVFVGALKNVAFAASTSDIKPEIASVCIYKEGETLVFVSTDSFRLAQYKVSKSNYTQNSEDFSPILVPIRNVHDIIRVLDDEPGDILIKSKTGQAAIVAQDVYLLSQLIDGTFPNLSQIFPKTRETQAIVRKHDLVQSLRISQIFADKFNRIELRVSPKENTFEVESKNQETGENMNSIEANLEGENIVMQFNGKYLIDALSVVSEDSVSLEFLDKNRPLSLKAVGNNDFVYLLMPLRV